MAQSHSVRRDTSYFLCCLWNREQRSAAVLLSCNRGLIPHSYLQLFRDFKGRRFSCIYMGGLWHMFCSNHWDRLINKKTTFKWLKNSPQTRYLHQRLLVQLLHVLRSHHELPVTNTQHNTSTKQRYLLGVFFTGDGERKTWLSVGINMLIITLSCTSGKVKGTLECSSTLPVR